MFVSRVYDDLQRRSIHMKKAIVYLAQDYCFAFYFC